MREGSIMVDLLRMFFLTVGKSQIAALGPLIKDVVRNSIPLEVDSTLLGVGGDSEVEQNRQNLINITQKFLDKINSIMLTCTR